MKYSFLKVLFWISCLLLVACKDEEADAPLSLSVEKIVAGHEVAEEALMVSTDGDWTAKVVTGDWCKLSPSAGTGVTLVKVQLEENNSGKVRETEIEVSAGNQVKRVNVIQNFEDLLSLSAPSFLVLSDQTTQKLTLTASSHWSLVETLPEWIQLDKLSGEAGEQVLNLTILKNPNADERSCTLNFKLDNTTKVTPLVIRQLGIYGSPTQRDSVALACIFNNFGDDLIAPGQTETSKVLFKKKFWTGPMKDWKGVTTEIINGAERVVGLELNSVVNDPALNMSPWCAGNAMPTEIGYLTELTTLDCSNVWIFGNLPAEICKLTKLTNLKLHNNNFSGSLPAELGALKELVTLDLSNNTFTGDLPKSIGELTNLKTLILSFNRFSQITDVFGNLKELVTFDVQNQMIVTTDPDGGVLPGPGLASSQRKSFSKGRANGGIDPIVERHFPQSLVGLPKLEKIFVNYCNMIGELPTGIGQNSYLTHFLAYGNKFTGTIPTSFGNLGYLQALNLSGNQLTGSIPVELCKCLKLTILILSDNLLDGTIPIKFADIDLLSELDLSNNKLTGAFPAGLCNVNLVSLNLSGNKGLTGELPEAIKNMGKLETLILSGCSFTSIPNTISSITLLSVFDMRGNQLTALPGNITNLYKLWMFDVRNNNIEGSIPSFKSSLLSTLLLSGNRFSGAIPDVILKHDNASGWNFHEDICPQQAGYVITNCPPSKHDPAYDPELPSAGGGGILG
ncbi:MAG: BACON domain-containing carbohydrate-binding protein [Odoribacter sp.]